MIYVNGLPVDEDEEVEYQQWLADNHEEVNMYD